MLLEDASANITSLPRALERVVISGGSSGLGAAVVKAIRAAGGGATSLDLNAAQDSPDDFAVDVADYAAVERVVREIVARHGPITAVVASAGIDACGRFQDVDAAAWERVIGVNLIGTAALVRAALPSLQQTGGRVVTVASTLGLRAVSDATAYCASKFGVVGFTRALAAELKGEVGVTLLIPGGMSTPFFDGRTEQYKPPADAKLNAPANVARAVLFALSQPLGCDIKELVVASATESSWP